MKRVVNYEKERKRTGSSLSKAYICSIRRGGLLYFRRDARLSNSSSYSSSSPSSVAPSTIRCNVHGNVSPVMHNGSSSSNSWDGDDEPPPNLLPSSHRKKREQGLCLFAMKYFNFSISKSPMLKESLYESLLLLWCYH